MRALFLVGLFVAAPVFLLGACREGEEERPMPSPQGSPAVPANGPTAFETLEIGDQSGITSERPQVFKLETEAGWAAFWSRHKVSVTPQPPLPPVDFSREMVIAVLDHQDPSGGFRFRITDIEEVAGRLVVRVSKETPGPDCIVALVITRPFHIVRTAQSDLEPQLAISEEIYSCG